MNVQQKMKGRSFYLLLPESAVQRENKNITSVAKSFYSPFAQRADLFLGKIFGYSKIISRNKQVRQSVIAIPYKSIPLSG